MVAHSGGDGHSSRPAVANGLQRLPGSSGGGTPDPFGPLPPRLAPGGVYHAIPVTGDPVRSYRTLSPLPVGAEAWTGGLLSVALSFESPRLDVIQHPALWSSDFPPALFRTPATVSPAPAEHRRVHHGGGSGGVKGERVRGDGGDSGIDLLVGLVFILSEYGGLQVDHAHAHGADLHGVGVVEGVVKLGQQGHVAA